MSTRLCKAQKHIRRADELLNDFGPISTNQIEKEWKKWCSEHRIDPDKNKFEVRLGENRYPFRMGDLVKGNTYYVQTKNYQEDQRISKRHISIERLECLYDTEKFEISVYGHCHQDRPFYMTFVYNRTASEGDYGQTIAWIGWRVSASSFTYLYSFQQMGIPRR